MYPLLQRWENSGKSQAAFARQEGLSQVTFSYWLRKYRAAQRDEIPGFLAVTPDGGGQQLFARLLLPDGIELHIHQNVPGAYLREILGW